MLNFLNVMNSSFKCDYSNQGFPTKFSINLANKNRGDPMNYRCNKAVHYRSNGFVVILISNSFETFNMPVVNLQRICSSCLGRSSRLYNIKHQCIYLLENKT